MFMSYIGNLNGPTKENILWSIPLSKLGVAPVAVEEDIAFEEIATQKKEVSPVQLDAEGQPFFEFVTAEGKPLYFFLDTPQLKGDVIAAVENGKVIGIAEQVALHQWRLKVAPPSDEPPPPPNR